jgi:hypothetical protein
MMNRERYSLELQVLQQKLMPNLYRFFDMNTGSPYVLLGARTNRGNVYTLRIELANFPESVPAAFVTRMLKDRNGNPLDSPSSSMHTLASEMGYTRLCHYGWNSWTPMVSIYKIYVKCRLWLEMYELHLQNGHHIDYYLNHQA